MKASRILFFALCAAFCCAVAAPSRAVENVSFLEKFTLAKDRDAALKELVPGTDDYYYYYCLQYQNTGKLAEVDKLLESWPRDRDPVRQTEIRHRQMLFLYKTDPGNALGQLARTLDLQFTHERERQPEDSGLPSVLDASLIGREKLAETILSRPESKTTLEKFEPSAYEWLIVRPLEPLQRRDLLKRLERSDCANLPQLIAEDLATQGSGGFGSLNIHRQLTLAQLEELVRLKPALLNEANFVSVYSQRLLPREDVVLQQDAEEREAFLERLQAFASRLDASHNSLKVHVLHHRLVHDRVKGVYDKDRFVSYLRLPRQTGYMNREFLAKPENRNALADLQGNLQDFTHMPPVKDDEWLVRSYLEHFFAEEKSYAPYEEFLDTNYLRRVFATTKLLCGGDSPEQWIAWLSPDEYAALRDRVDIDFDPANKQQFAPEEPVTLDVWIKNANTSIVRIFEINTTSYYRQYAREVNTDIDLDGLVANEEKVHSFDAPPIHREKRQFVFPSLNKRGIYLIDFIGNGKSSRALIRKGRLHYAVRTGAAGQVFSVYNEANQRVMGARLWISGHEYAAESDGAVTVPFTATPGPENVVLSDDTFSCFDTFQHEGETYSLVAGIHVDRESLCRGQVAQVLLRPRLNLDGMPVALSILEDPTLVISSTDRDNVPAMKEVRGFRLYEDRESVYEFRVPEDLKSVSFALKGRVRKMLTGQKEDVAAQDTFMVNQIDATEHTEALHLSHVAGGYFLDLLGKSGEPKPQRPVQVTLKHRDFKEPIRQTLQTDKSGRLQLGALDDIVQIRASAPEGVVQFWELGRDFWNCPNSLMAKVGDAVRLPYMGKETTPQRSEFSLFEKRGGPCQDRFDALTIENGFLTANGLPAGDYDLLVKPTWQRIFIRVTEGVEEGDFILAKRGYLEAANPKPLHIVSVTPSADSVEIRLANNTPLSRVHVVATIFAPAHPMFANMSRITWPEPRSRYESLLDCAYLSSRNIGDEYRYVLDRKYAKKFAGAMFERPGLLLSPWALKPTETQQQPPAPGAAPDAAPAPPEAPKMKREKPVLAEREQVVGGEYANLDFLPDGGVALYNLVAGEDGIVRIPRKDLKNRRQLFVIAVSPRDTVYRECALEDTTPAFRDLRLAHSADPKTHVVEHKRITPVRAGEEWTQGAPGAQFEVYDSLAKVYSLYATLTQRSDLNLNDFDFIARWPQLTDAEKRDKYSKFACHDLNFFLFKKDAPFFESVVQPFLKNKADKQFMDRWLLKEDLRDYLQAWNFERLNIAERILLAQSVTEEHGRVLGHVRDLYALVKPDPDRRDFLFMTALQGGALEQANSEGGGLPGIAGPANRPQDVEVYQAYDINGDGTSEAVALFKAKVPVAATPSGARPAKPAKDDKGGLRRVQVGGELRIREKVESSAPANIPVLGQLSDGEGKKGTDKKDSASRSEAEVAGRAEVRQLYRTPDKTEEWVESNYYRLPIERQVPELITATAFWRDFAEFSLGGDAVAAKQGFLSPNFIEAGRNRPEALFALAVLDLPFEAGAHETRRDGDKLVIKAASPAVFVHKQIAEAKPTSKTATVLVSENFFDPKDRYQFEENEQSDKFVAGEFLVQTVYGCKVVATNSGSSPQRFDMLLQIPRGAVPVKETKYTRTVAVRLEPYSTTALEYYFYFPSDGAFSHYPAQAARNGELLASAGPTELKVVPALTTPDTTSWRYVSQRAESQQVIDYLAKENLNRLNLADMAWRMKDRDFYNTALGVLGQRHVYNHTLWAYAIHHKDLPAAREFLKHCDDFVNQCGPYIDTELLTIDPVARKTYEHMEYAPLVNARVHRLGAERRILNDRLAQQYDRLMRILSHRPQFDQDDLMEITYYLLLQDRLEDALEFFGQVSRDKLPAQLQYDYIAAYVAFCREDPAAARAVAQKYTNYPVDRWQKLFANVLSQLDEVEGAMAKVVDAKVADTENRAQRQDQLATTEPSLEFKVEGVQGTAIPRVTVNYQNISECRVNYYLMDVELLFSRNPFGQQFSEQFATIRPNHSETRQLPAGGSVHTFDLPKQFHGSNVVVEIEASGVRRTQTYYDNNLNVQVIEPYAQVKVAQKSSGKPLGKVYVKVFARMNDGSTKFYKDGYTDMRGRFDYAALSTGDLENVQRFAMLIVSESDGAVVREANPPKR